MTDTNANVAPGMRGAGASGLFLRTIGALPDGLTGLACLVVWISPFAFGQESVKTVVVTMLLEFLLVHGTGFFTAIAHMDDVKPSRRMLLMLGLSLFYSLFLAAICLGFGEWWPLPLFAWLLVGKMLWVRANPKPRPDEMMRQMGTWAFSVVAYLGAVIGGVLLPLPYLGLTPDVVARLGLSGGGEWIERPHTAVAGMMFYFLALAAFKWVTSSRTKSYDAALSPLKRGIKGDLLFLAIVMRNAKAKPPFQRGRKTEALTWRLL